MIAAPISRSALFLGKALANYVIVFAVELVSMPICGIFYRVHWTEQFWTLMAVLALGAWALTIIGTFFSALTVNIKLREIMLPMLVYPVMIPALMSVMMLSQPLVLGEPLTSDMQIWVKMIVVFDVIFTALSLVLIETVLVG
jgi:heme exporter protein B